MTLDVAAALLVEPTAGDGQRDLEHVLLAVRADGAAVHGLERDALNLKVLGEGDHGHHEASVAEPREDEQREGRTQALLVLHVRSAQLGRRPRDSAPLLLVEVDDPVR